MSENKKLTPREELITKLEEEINSQSKCNILMSNCKENTSVNLCVVILMRDQWKGYSCGSKISLKSLSGKCCSRHLAFDAALKMEQLILNKKKILR